ncbi:hypothetical protein SAMN06265365_10213 [Tistlia consotensis]|uniref:Entericidin EcnA/B family protein n=1 Tax=Tistlia consotensis USBA 355 TaxID=560819 RepID=A0A1Y6BHW3_9PROT|nr:hypothetical protein [Tistlia consotensis]SMF10094.1 hypothetical protein SAMN05428998_104303 [Tistlia consotensis USBA 355]SNR34005.1 hypothetical protein SAMN06265365_10213 [Tistlia consotensis]
MAKLSTLVAAAAILAFAGTSALACEFHDKTAQSGQASGQVSTQTAQNPATTTTTAKTEDAAQ